MTQPKTLPLNGITPISHLGVIRAVGADAASFLHGQLSNDFALLKFDQARLAAFCTAKGRMLASFIGFRRSADEIVLIADGRIQKIGTKDEILPQLMEVAGSCNFFKEDEA